MAVLLQICTLLVTTPERNTPIKPNSTTRPGPHYPWIFGHGNLSEGDARGCQKMPEDARDAAIALPWLLALFVEANPDFPRTGCQYSH